MPATGAASPPSTRFFPVSLPDMAPSHPLLLGLSGAVLAAVIFILSLLPNQNTGLTNLTTIHGVPYVAGPNGQEVVEHLAHADLQLKQNVLAKNLILTVTFTPLNVKTLAIGLRESPFWLSYNPVPLYTAGTAPGSQTVTRTVIIPLTDKLPDVDQSLDLMFFADQATLQLSPEQAERDAVAWRLHDIQTEIVSSRPSWPQTKRWLKNTLYRVKPL